MMVYFADRKLEDVV